MVAPALASFAARQINGAKLAGAVCRMHVQLFGECLQGVEVIGSAPKGDAGTGVQIEALQQIDLILFPTGFFQQEKLDLDVIFVRPEVIRFMALRVGAERSASL